jgi:hypothetical protein
MPGLVPGIHFFLPLANGKTWMAGISGVKMRFALLPGHADVTFVSLYHSTSLG